MFSRMMKRSCNWWWWWWCCSWLSNIGILELCKCFGNCCSDNLSKIDFDPIYVRIKSSSQETYYRLDIEVRGRNWAWSSSFKCQLCCSLKILMSTKWKHWWSIGFEASDLPPSFRDLTISKQKITRHISVVAYFRGIVKMLYIQPV